MTSLKKIFWGSTLSFYVNGAICLLIAGVAFAAPLTKTPRHIASNDVSFLRNQLSATATTASLEPLKKWVNGVETEGCFDTGSGFILIEDDLGRREWASYGQKACDGSNVTTLSEMRRGLSPVDPSFGSGTGLAFDAGATVRIIDYTVIYEMMMYRDLFNDLTGSGAVNCGGTSQPCVFLGDYTTAQRDAFSYIKDGAIIYNTTLDIFEGREAGGWTPLGGSGTVNATETAAGKVELATMAEQADGSGTGSTSASLVLQSRYAVQTPKIYTPASLRCGTGATTNVATWAGTTNGAFTFTLNGTLRTISSINFTGDATMTDVADTLQTAIRAATLSSETVTWTQGTGTGFTITSADTTSTSSITKLSTPGVGTDISGAGGTAYMDCDAGSPNTVTVTDKVINYEANAQRIPILNASGALSPELGGTGVAAPTASGVLIAQGTRQMTTVAPGTSNNVLKSDGQNWVSGAFPSEYTVVNLNTSVGTGTGASNTNEVFPSGGTYTIPANDMSSIGQMYILEAIGTVDVDTDTNTLRFRVNSTEIGQFTLSSGGTTTGASFTLRCLVTVRATGASGAVGTYCHYWNNGPTSTGVEFERAVSTTVNTTTTNQLRVTADYGASKAGNSTSIVNMVVTKITNN